MKFLRYILVCFVLLTLMSCGGELTMSPLNMNIVFSLPADEIEESSAKAPAIPDGCQRVMGDPGMSEFFHKPRYGYFYLVYSDGTQEHVEILQNGPLLESNWQLRGYSGDFKQPGNKVYEYKYDFVLLLIDKVRTWGRMYAVMSYTQLPNLHVKGQSSSYIPQTESDVLNLVFDVSNDDIITTLQDIYSTPAKYKYPDDEGQYYGTINNFAYNPHTDEGKAEVRVAMPLYHVASKVDVIWNVQESLQRDMRVTDLKATHLYNGDCYLFRPTDNTVSTDTYGSGYEMQLTSDNIGTQWEGRSYFYAIPYTNNAGKCPLQLEVQANGNTTGSYKTTVLNDPSSPFVPWLRGTIKISSNVETLYN